ncbi:FG-GAP-like repeat-containing protein [Alloyangia pacifica]|uniref:FG-GAP-like repeat-containing protein n=1 Tax=Alloyangia pacifica TaxID=311180 RepID=UPI001CFCDF0F|nr:FG-GAP-like repeat-containing protein [Alloyangia pacifica]
MPASQSAPSLFDFPETPFTATLSLGLTEAEDLSIASGFSVVSNPHASGGSYLQATAATSRAGGVFDGPVGLYDINVSYFDETDGVSYMEVLVNGAVVAAFDWDATGGDAIVTKASAAETLISGLVLAPGDVIELRGMSDGGEPLRTDAVEILASPPPALGESFVIEAEDLQILSGFTVGNNGAASGGQNLQHTGGGTARAVYTVQQAGTFDLTLGYFDETDGASWMQVLVNGTVVADWAWDATGGAAIASTASRATEVIEALELQAGDVIELRGQGDGGEPLRADYLEFTAVEGGASGPTPPGTGTLDLWYARDGEVYVALNDGDGAFTELDTGVETGGSLRAVDMDGDGDFDFLRVELVDPFPLPDPSTTTDHFEFVVETTVYENDGSGGFTVATTDAVPYVTEGDGYPYQALDRARDIVEVGEAGDIDGDGDVDFVGASLIGGDFLIFDNNGDDSFSLTVVPVPTEYLAFGELSPGGNYTRLADMNDDGLLDLLLSVAWETSSTLVMINDGAGGFDWVGSYGGSDDGNSTEIPADLDGDGDLDVLYVAISDGGGISIYVNDGTGASAGYGPWFPDGELNGIGALQIADFDGDGALEMVNASIDDSSEGLDPGLRVFEFPVEDGMIDIVVDKLDPSLVGQVTAQGDFEGDGDVDLILTTRGVSSEVYVLFNDGAAHFAAVPAGVADIENEYAFMSAGVYSGEFGNLPIA